MSFQIYLFESDWQGIRKYFNILTLEKKPCQSTRTILMQSNPSIFFAALKEMCPTKMRKPKTNFKKGNSHTKTRMNNNGSQGINAEKDNSETSETVFRVMNNGVFIFVFLLVRFSMEPARLRQRESNPHR